MAELEQGLGAPPIPAPALAFEASLDLHPDVVLHGPASVFDGRGWCPMGGGPAGIIFEVPRPAQLPNLSTTVP